MVARFLRDVCGASYRVSMAFNALIQDYLVLAVPFALLVTGLVLQSSNSGIDQPSEQQPPEVTPNARGRVLRTCHPLTGWVPPDCRTCDSQHWDGTTATSASLGCTVYFATAHALEWPHELTSAWSVMAMGFVMMACAVLEYVRARFFGVVYSHPHLAMRAQTSTMAMCFCVCLAFV